MGPSLSLWELSDSRIFPATPGVVRLDSTICMRLIDKRIDRRDARF
jgi:hypothetical protein